MVRGPEEIPGAWLGQREEHFRKQEWPPVWTAAETEGRRLGKCNVPGDLQNQPCRMLGTEVPKRVWEARQDGWQESGLRGSVD